MVPIKTHHSPRISHSFKALFPGIAVEYNVFEICDARFAALSSKPTTADIALQHITNQIERAFIGLLGQIRY
jgi:hypothetical protein